MARDENGLTDKQKQSIPVIASAVTVYEGVRQCVEQRIVSRDHFYHVWKKEPPFVAALNAERERIQGEVAERVRQRFLMSVERVVDTVIKHATSSRADALRGAEIVLNSIGIDTGRSSRFSATTKVVQSGETPEEALAKMSREEILDLINKNVSTARRLGWKQ